MGETKLNRVAAYVEPHLHEQLNKICQKNGCTMSVLINRFLENQLSLLADSTDSFSRSSSLTDSTENTLLENKVKSLENEITNIKAVVTELRNNPESETANSAGSAVTQLAHQLAQLRENLRNKPEFKHFPNSQAQASSADLDDSAVTQLKENHNKKEDKKENLEAELEKAFLELYYLKLETYNLRIEKCNLQIEAIEKDLSTLINQLNHKEEKKILTSELEKYKSALAEGG